MTKLQNPPKNRYNIQAVSVAISILDYIAKHPARTLSQIAEGLELTPSLCFRMLTTLESHGMVLRNENRLYSLGYTTVYLGYRAQEELPLNTIAEPVLEQLAAATSESVHLVILDGLERVIVAMLESPHLVRVSTPVGAKFPLYFGGTGLCMLAWMDEETQNTVLASKIEPRTPDMEDDPERLRVVLREIREQGYHVARGDFADGAYSIAAPIFLANGQVTASVCATGPLSRLTEEAERLIVENVVEAGKRISVGLGYRG